MVAGSSPARLTIFHCGNGQPAMKVRHPIRAKFENGMTWLAFRVIPRLPRRAVVWLAALSGTTAYLFSRQLVRIGRANLDLAFGATKTPTQKNRILRRSFRSFALVMLDAFWFSHRSEARIARFVDFNDCFQPLFVNRPHICITAHYGNWEVMGMAITARGFPLHSVAKPLKNETVDEQFIAARRRTGQHIIRRQGALRGLLKAVTAGDKVALVLDQNTRQSEGGRFFPFFDRPVLVSTAPAALAVKTKTDIFIGMMTPQSDGRYVGDFGIEIPIAPFLAMDTDTAADALTLRITRELESFLRRQPDHWLWTYKRWKFIPEDHDAARYPFYARRVESNESHPRRS